MLWIWIIVVFFCRVIIWILMELNRCFLVLILRMVLIMCLCDVFVKIGRLCFWRFWKWFKMRKFWLMVLLKLKFGLRICLFCGILVLFVNFMDVLKNWWMFVRILILELVFWWLCIIIIGIFSLVIVLVMVGFFCKFYMLLMMIVLVV